MHGAGLIGFLGAYTGPNEPNPRVVDVLEGDDDDPERFKVLVVEKA